MATEESLDPEEDLYHRGTSIFTFEKTQTNRGLKTSGISQRFSTSKPTKGWFFSKKDPTLGCPWKFGTIVSKLGFFTYLGDGANLPLLGL